MIITQGIFPGGKIMKVHTITNFTRPFLLAVFLLLFSAVPGRSETTDGAEWVQVSINAGETYLIENIKLGTKPEFRIAENPNAFLSYDTAPGKLTMLGTEAGRWVVTVTNTSDKSWPRFPHCARRRQLPRPTPHPSSKPHRLTTTLHGMCRSAPAWGRTTRRANQSALLNRTPGNIETIHRFSIPEPATAASPFPAESIICPTMRSR